MRVTVITPPQPIVSWEEAKRHLREDTDEQKTLVESYIAAATAWLDGPAGWLGRSLGEQTLELVGWLSCERTELPYGPIVDIISIKTEDDAGVSTDVADDTYRLADGALVVATGAAWVRQPLHRVRYVAGYPDGGTEESPSSTVPTPIKQAILLLVGHWFITREAVNVGNIVNAVPFAVDALLSPYRVYR